MTQFKIYKAYETTQELIKENDLSINAKWQLFKLRKELLSHYEFYASESQALISKYKTTVNGNAITFESPELAQDYKAKQNEIDLFEAEVSLSKHQLKLSDIPNITVEQIELLDGFIEFIPE